MYDLFRCSWSPAALRLQGPSVVENEVIDLPSVLGIRDSCCFANMTDVTEQSASVFYREEVIEARLNGTLRTDTGSLGRLARFLCISGGCRPDQNELSCGLYYLAAVCIHWFVLQEPGLALKEFKMEFVTTTSL